MPLAIIPAMSLSRKWATAARVLERRHGAAELVGLAGGEAGAHDGHLHGLLLEERHAQRLAEDALS